MEPFCFFFYFDDENTLGRGLPNGTVGQEEAMKYSGIKNVLNGRNRFAYHI